MSCDPDVSAAAFTATSDYVLGPGGEQVTELSTGGTWQHTNVWAGSQLLATYDTTGMHFYFDDPLGSRRTQTDSSGAVEQSCVSLPFGDGETCTPSPTEHLFTGKERDAESGNDYFGARYYASSMGRWLSPDWSAKAEPVPYAKLDDPQSLNLYSYVLNNPLAHADPDGHECEACKTFYDAIRNIISVKSTVTSGTHFSVSILGVKVGISSGASISTIHHPFSEQPTEIKGENKSTVEFKIGSGKAELNIPMQTPTTPSESNPSVGAGTEKPNVKVSSDGEVSLASITATMGTSGPGGGIEVNASTKELITAAKTLVPAVVGGVSEILQGAIHDPRQPQQPIVPMPQKLNQ